MLDETEDVQVRYKIHHGIFKRIALRAAVEGLRIEDPVPEFDELWEQLVREIEQEDIQTAVGKNGKHYQLRLSKPRSIETYPCELDEEDNVTNVSSNHQTASKESARLYWEHRNELGPDPEEVSQNKTNELFARERGGKGGNHYTALWIVYTQLLRLSQSAGIRKPEVIDKVAIDRVQSALDNPGSTTTFLFSAQSPQYVLIIDEINRGNMSKILGELITLLEPDKRLSARNEIKMPLTYQQESRFAVPPNLHVIGTMNTADRSIALMDVALRRRFTFEELMPDASVIRRILSKGDQNAAFVDLVVDVFNTLNDRIRFLYDRDHRLGHSFFLNASNVNSLRQVFVDRVVPMLQEYFYGAWDKICIVLGCPYNESGEPKRNDKQRDLHLLKDGKYAYPIVTAEMFSEVGTLGFDHDDYEDRVDYHVNPDFLQEGKLSIEELYRTFLGVLSTDKNEFDNRLEKLQG